MALGEGMHKIPAGLGELREFAGDDFLRGRFGGRRGAEWAGERLCPFYLGRITGPGLARLIPGRHTCRPLVVARSAEQTHENEEAAGDDEKPEPSRTWRRTVLQILVLVVGCFHNRAIALFTLMTPPHRQFV